MTLIIDRFEEDKVIIEVNGKDMIVLPKKMLPIEAKEGDLLKLVIDQEATDTRKKKIEELANKLWE